MHIIARKALRELKKYDMSLIYIPHDIGIVNKVSDKIAVMYRGEVVEIGPKKALFNSPIHPYTRALINCIPRAGIVKEVSRLNTIPGFVRNRNTLETGCPLRKIPYWVWWENRDAAKALWVILSGDF